MESNGKYVDRNGDVIHDYQTAQLFGENQVQTVSMHSIN